MNFFKMLLSFIKENMFNELLNHVICGNVLLFVIHGYVFNFTMLRISTCVHVKIYSIMKLSMTSGHFLKSFKKSNHIAKWFVLFKEYIHGFHHPNL